jgi:asparagine synthase (glutamine-hydrolysing)
MCGFAGFLGVPRDLVDARETLIQMGDAIVHRGPDECGDWFDLSQQVGLVHRRLSILDLSPAGSQPMVSPSGRYVIAYNGEIYNHLQIRDELAGHEFGWRGHSDTETLLCAIEVWGLDRALEKSIGMFAFALWDRHEQSLTLARDRLGEKPLYYGYVGNGLERSFVFASELKALVRFPGFNAAIDRDALAGYMRHNCIGSPQSIYQGIAKLEPGCTARMKLGDATPTVKTYWSVVSTSLDTTRDFRMSPEGAVAELEQRLQTAISGQMISDRPLGAFLSGGIDSTTVVALMQSMSQTPVQSFTIGFDVPGYNEAEHASAVAKHLGTEHTEWYVTSQDALDVIPTLPTIYDEPFADSSQIPTHLVCQFASKSVTVALSGDGGDELFSGYNRYAVMAGYGSKFAALPRPVRAAAGAVIKAIPPKQWESLLRPFLSAERMRRLGDKLHKTADVLSSRSADDLYKRLVSHWPHPEQVVIGVSSENQKLNQAMHALQALDATERMMVLDMLTYLPDDILTKVDRAAMACSLETRIPMLDKRVVEFAWQMPLSIKRHDGRGKWPLRQLLKRHIPERLLDRPKMGFGIPLDHWLRHELRDWAQALLEPSRLRSEGYFKPEPIQRKWQEHLSGKHNWSYQLWDVLMFQAWLQQVRHP